MPTPSADDILALAIRHVNAGQAEHARILCEHALAQGPHPGAHQLLAVLALQQGRPAEAKGHADASLQLRPDHPPTLGVAGDAALAVGDAAAATRAFERIVALAPTHADGWFKLALARQDARDFAGAAAALRESLRLKPGSPEAEVNLGIVLQEVGRIDEAMAAYGRAYRLRPDTFGRIAHALATPAAGRLYLDLETLRAELAAPAGRGSGLQA
jgi:tetratricopeptide (TPR) repeat protein